MGDKWGTRVNSCGPRHPEWETSVEDKCGSEVGDKCKIMRSKTPRVGDKCGTQVEDKCKLMRPKAPECEGHGTQVLNHALQDTQSWRQVRETSGRQV